MKKSIKVSKLTYERLLSIQRPRETFDDTIWRLLQLAELLTKAEPIIRGHQAYEQWRKEQDDPVYKAMLERRDLEARTISPKEQTP